MINFGCGVYLDSIDKFSLSTLKKWRNDYRIRKWTRQNDILSDSDQSAWGELLSIDKSIRMYSIFDLNENGIGVCGLTDLDLVNRKAEFSLYIEPGFQRQGHGKNALKTLFSHGFNTYGLEVIWGETFEHNPAAKMFVHIGCKLDGIRRNFYYRDGRFIHAYLYSILRSEWENSEAFKNCREQRCSP